MEKIQFSRHTRKTFCHLGSLKLNMESHFWDVAEIRWELLAMQWQVLQAQTEAIQNFTHCGWPKHCASACEADILGNPGLDIGLPGCREYCSFLEWDFWTNSGERRYPTFAHKNHSLWRLAMAMFAKIPKNNHVQFNGYLINLGTGGLKCVDVGCRGQEQMKQGKEFEPQSFAWFKGSVHAYLEWLPKVLLTQVVKTIRWWV